MRGTTTILTLLALVGAGPARAADWSLAQGGNGGAWATQCLASDEVAQVFTSLCVSVGCDGGEGPGFAFALQQVALPGEARVTVTVGGEAVADLLVGIEPGSAGGVAPLAGQEALVAALREGRLAEVSVGTLEGTRRYDVPLSGARAAIDAALAACPAPSGGVATPGAESHDPASLAIAENAAFCEGEGGTPSVAAGFLRQADVDGDGVNDVLLDWGGLSCDGRRDFCGTGGCTKEVWLGDPEGPYRMLLSNLIIRIDRPGPGRLDIVLDGGACGLSGAESCLERYRVEGGRLVRLP